MLKTRPHQENLEKSCVGGIFLPDHTVFFAFSKRPWVCPEYLHYFLVLWMSRNALKTNYVFMTPLNRICISNMFIRKPAFYLNLEFKLCLMCLHACIIIWGLPYLRTFKQCMHVFNFSNLLCIIIIIWPTSFVLIIIHTLLHVIILIITFCSFSLHISPGLTIEKKMSMLF